MKVKHQQVILDQQKQLPLLLNHLQVVSEVCQAASLASVVYQECQEWEACPEECLTHLRSARC
jgi:hypothetical protein